VCRWVGWWMGGLVCGLMCLKRLVPLCWWQANEEGRNALQHVEIKQGAPPLNFRGGGGAGPPPPTASDDEDGECVVSDSVLYFSLLLCRCSVLWCSCFSALLCSLFRGLRMLASSFFANLR